MSEEIKEMTNEEAMKALGEFATMCYNKGDVYKRQQFDKTAEYNQMKVLLAMQKNRVSEECFGSSSGYGYNDYGRDTLEKVYADTFHTEACLVLSLIHI